MDDPEALRAELTHLNGQHIDRNIPVEYYQARNIFVTNFLLLTSLSIARNYKITTHYVGQTANLLSVRNLVLAPNVILCNVECKKFLFIFALKCETLPTVEFFFSLAL